MNCPFTGKPCLLPKEVFVTEYKDNTTQHLFLCKQCGDDYIKKLEENDKITKTFDVISAKDDNITKTSHVVNDEGEAVIESKPIEKPALLPQIKKIEAKMQEASDKEDYETAAGLRDILKKLKEEYEKEKKKE